MAKKLFSIRQIFFRKSKLKTNIWMLVNLELILGFMLEIKSIPIYQHGHAVSAMCFNMGRLLQLIWVKIILNLIFRF